MYDNKRYFLKIILTTIVASILVGIIGGSFREILNHIYMHEIAIIEYTKKEYHWILVVMLCVFVSGTMMALARYIVNFEPEAGGSGIQQVEAVFKGITKPSKGLTLVIKYIGGLLAMSSGAALGREGPTVQMAAIIGNLFSKIAKLKKCDQYLLYTAVAGGGLAVAFNAPLAGAVFIFEEVSKSVNLKRGIVGGISVAISTLSMWYFFGINYELDVKHIKLDIVSTIPSILIFSLFTGLFGKIYTKTTIGTLELVGNIKKLNEVVKSFIIGGIIGIFIYISPYFGGGGEIMTNKILNNELIITQLVVLFVVRMIISPISYAAKTPGGIFAPILLMGCIMGAAYVYIFDIDSEYLQYYCLLGMVGLFSSIVQAPITGVLLISEMSGDFSITVPLLIVSITSIAISKLFNNKPIYDILIEKTYDLKNVTSKPK